MNSNITKAIALSVGLLFLVVFVTFDIFGGGGNQLGRTLWWAMIVGAFFGFALPKSAVPVYLVALFYLDFFKRMLVVGDGMTMQDVMVSLGSGPVVIVAACFYCTLSIIVGRIDFKRPLDWLFYLGCVMVSVVGFFMVSGSILERGQSMMGTSLVGMTALACYCLFRQDGEARSLIKVVVIGAIPMALYTLWQFFIGFSGWEDRYIRSGLSPVLYNHYMLTGNIDDMRPFSTLNLHPSVGAVSGVLALLTLVGLKGSSSKPVVFPKSLKYWVVGLLFIASMLLAQNRTTYFIPVFYVMFAWAYMRPTRTLFMYGFGAVTAVVSVWKSDYLYNNINVWSDAFLGTFVGERFGTLGTFQARLIGFMNLKVPQHWSPFGLEENKIPLSHDPFSDFIFRFGYVPVGLLVLGGLMGLLWWHRSCYRIADPAARSQVIKMTAIIASLTVCGLVYGNLLFVSPVNAVLGALVGLVVARVRGEEPARVRVPSRSTSATPFLAKQPVGFGAGGPSAR